MARVPEEGRAARAHEPQQPLVNPLLARIFKSKCSSAGLVRIHVGSQVGSLRTLAE